ncbi:MAG: hypothetical protein JOZ69_11790 [Myxococcales bacterium]|nr:hypothetical protein [Myxococcales bacterium]
MSTIHIDEVILTPDEHAKLASMVERFGEVGAAERLRLSRVSVLRLLSRRPVRLGTISLARISLSKAV